MKPGSRNSIPLPRGPGTKLEEIQLLRAVAAGLVVWSHASDWAPAAGVVSDWPVSLRSVGAAGVDLFFILSGFIIARSAFGGRQSPRPADFLLRRFLRIAPLYWLWSAVVYAWQTSAGNSFAPGQVVKTMTFFPWVETQGFVLPILYLGWTLSYELAFYLLVGLALLLGGRGATVVLAIGSLLALASVWASSPVAWIPFLANPLWLEFIAGMALAAGYRRLRAAPPAAGILALSAGLALWTGAAGFGPAAFADLAATLNNDVSALRVLWWGGGALGVVTGTVILAGRWRTIPRWIVALGDVSFTWYLTQAITLPVAARLWSMLPLPGGMGTFALFAVVVTGAFALVLGHAIELPLHRRTSAWVRRHLARPSRRLPVTARPAARRANPFPL